MIEVGFAIILGFAIASTLCGLLEDGSRYDQVLMRALVYLVLLSMIIAWFTIGSGMPHAVVRTLIYGSVFVQTIWLLLGAVIALVVQVFAEGYFHALWVKLHPQSAPTPEARFGQRAQPVRRSGPVAATLVGTSTEYLNSGLDLRTDTLIRLCFYSFEDRGALTLSRLESNLRLGTGQRQKAFHKLAAGMRKRPKLKQTIHRYCRSVNGSSRMSQCLFSDLCRLARDTRNMDSETLGRLNQTGLALGIPAHDVALMINGSR